MARMDRSAFAFWPDGVGLNVEIKFIGDLNS